jgi:hypothetical protein
MLPWIPAAILAGCIAPTTFGLHTDGVIGTAGTVDLAGGYGSTVKAMDTRDGDQFGFAGGEFGVAVTDDVRVSLGAAFPENTFVPQAQALIRVVGREDRPLAVSAVAGAGGLWTDGQLGETGLHGGAVVSYEVLPELRPYAGGLVNVAFLSDDDERAWFADVAGGATWRPALTDHLSLLLLAEVTWLHAFPAAGGDGGDVLAGTGMIGLTLRPARRGDVDPPRSDDPPRSGTSARP